MHCISPFTAKSKMNRAKILLVDDDPSIRTVVTEALRRDGHDVRTAATVAEQVSMLEQFVPDVLITDVMLPDGTNCSSMLTCSATVAAVRTSWPSRRSASVTTKRIEGSSSTRRILARFTLLLAVKGEILCARVFLRAQTE